MLRWLKRNWPLMLKSTCEDWIDDLSQDFAEALVTRNLAEQEAGRLKEKLGRMTERVYVAEQTADKANLQMGSMQTKFAQVMAAKTHGEWQHYADKAIMAVDGLHGVVQCCVSEPIQFGRAEAIGAVRTTSVEMARLQIAIGLTKDCPPELVANNIADKVRFAVLQKWRDQSILLRGVDVPDPAAV